MMAAGGRLIMPTPAKVQVAHRLVRLEDPVF